MNIEMINDIKIYGLKTTFYVCIIVLLPCNATSYFFKQNDTRDHYFQMSAREIKDYCFEQNSGKLLSHCEGFFSGFSMSAFSYLNDFSTMEEKKLDCISELFDANRMAQAFKSYYSFHEPNWRLAGVDLQPSSMRAMSGAINFVCKIEKVL